MTDDSERPTDSAPRPTLSILERRRIEAEFAREVFDSMVAHAGEEAARTMLRDAVTRMAERAGAAMAAEDRAQGSVTLETFADRLKLWQQDDALRLEVLERGPDQLDFNVVRCRYAELYEALGVRSIGDILSCNRDGQFICGYDSRMTLTRSQTIMAGASHCDFRYRRTSGAATATEPAAEDPTEDGG
ncbi:2-amino-thiazoline-4-carboxylic acid hydrolase [Roseospira marina]|uniref:2-amino-thiazoline-4-carboxylic acid hydrolase n=1 Tax=Roseospira marina TaxID=140057 RepID=A0A5M6ID64_9PROT|nr:L-2-amino-thiazoline-4-carboxylic acid hydrolase [Roseospira marina]KAA5606221.1 2-amino-thiazoline-4-carboxylic acid hydrolase [Roseospira marina]MBB4314371.1 putative ArsR family transcriptional regulator [Roseospira marina]MBB5087531.1 putative ArsR family transcriptional regulator [Roseospira marina]